LQPPPTPEQKAFELTSKRLTSKRLWLLTAVTYILVVAMTILAIVVYRHMDAQIRNERHADPDQHN
jgi:uncharacterized membrane protein YqhA